MSQEPEAKRINIKWLIAIVAIFLIANVLVGVAYWSFASEYQNKIYPGVWVGRINLGGLTKDAATKIISSQTDTINQNGFVFNYQGHKTVLLPIIISPNGNFTDQIISFDVAQTIAAAFAVGHGPNFFINLKDRMLSGNRRHQIPLATTIDRDKIKIALQEELLIYETPAQDAKLQVNFDSANNEYIFSVAAEAAGQVADYDSGIVKLTTNLANINNDQIILSSVKQDPSIYRADCLNVNVIANDFLTKAPITLTYNDQSFTINKKTLSKLLGLQKDSKKIVVGLDSVVLQQYLQDNPALKINRPAQNSKFTIANGKVIEFQSNQDGVELNLASSANKIISGLASGSSTIALAINIVRSEVENNNVDNLGIKEIIGTGKSNFAGSPKNRRYNIKVGAATLNGLLIKPTEEFSTVKALGEINAAAGYLPELVIKGNKTTPEYGGGLCQIGTTMFRTALASGLPITARRSHSYRVSYYEPAGTDATIYDPQPDLRFINDTGNYILIQTRIEGDNLFFDFWGAKDGRVSTTTYPKIYNIVRPQPSKTIETLDLKPGEKKCTEKAHNGADAYFDYTVDYPNGDKKEERFKSHYVPWREICLLGVVTLNASSTTDVVTPTTNINPNTTN